MSAGDLWELKHIAPEGAKMNEFAENQLIDGMAIVLGKSYLSCFFRYCNACRVENSETITHYRLILEFVLEFSQIPDTSFANYLIELIVWRPPKTILNRSITVRNWRLFLKCMGLLLRADFDKLLSLRIIAGLLTPEAENSKVSTKIDPSKDKEKNEKAKKKKEKVLFTCYL